MTEAAHEEAQALPVSAEQRAEIERRLAAIDAGTMPVHPWEEVKQRLLNAHKHGAMSLSRSRDVRPLLRATHYIRLPAVNGSNESVPDLDE